MKETLALLDAYGIDYEFTAHEPVYTIDEMARLGLNVKWHVPKNLFLRDAAGKKHYLVITDGSSRTDLDTLRHRLSSTRLSFASDDRLMKWLGLQKGAVCPFGVLNDEERHVEIYIDKSLSGRGKLGFHPNVNTATVYLEYSDLLGLLRKHGSKVTEIELTGTEETD